MKSSIGSDQLKRNSNGRSCFGGTAYQKVLRDEVTKKLLLFREIVSAPSSRGGRKCQSRREGNFVSQCIRYSLIVQRQVWFAKTLADFEINDLAALPPVLL